jgi:hypothetical protein
MRDDECEECRNAPGYGWHLGALGVGEWQARPGDVALDYSYPGYCGESCNGSRCSMCEELYHANRHRRVRRPGKKKYEAWHMAVYGVEPGPEE